MILKSKLKSAKILIPISIVLAMAVTLFVVIGHASADVVKASSMSLEKQVESYWYYQATQQCMSSVGSWQITNPDDVSSGNWFDTGFTLGSVGNSPGGYVMRDILSEIGNDGTIACAKPNNMLMRQALQFWGLSGVDVMCGSGILVRQNGTDCVQGNGDFDWSSLGSKTTSSQFASYIKKMVYDNKDPSLSNAAWYLYYRNTFLNGCAYGVQPLTSKPSGANVYELVNISYDQSTGRTSQAVEYYIGTRAPNDGVVTLTNPNTNKTCQDLANSVKTGSTYANAYNQQFYAQRCTSAFGYTASDQIDICAKALMNGYNDPGYCILTYPDVVGDNLTQSGKVTGGINLVSSRDICFRAQYQPKKNGVYVGELCYENYSTNTERVACSKGAVNASDSNYCNVTYPAPDNLNASTGKLPTDTNKTSREACLVGQNNIAKDAIASSDPLGTVAVDPPKTPSDTQSTCGISGVGWIVCPVMTFLGDLTDTSFNFLASNFLETPVSLVANADNSNPVYVTWSIMRSFANVAFVIMFLIIIFSQLTGVGVTNYGVKKTLPRLIIAAILVNVSFFICGLAVDLSNVLGYSLNSLFSSGQFASIGQYGQAGNQGWGVAVIVAGLIAGTVTAVLAISIPVLLAALLAVLMIVLTLVARSALIVVLIVISPLAFVAYLLPNTEQWFKKWTKLFSSLLLLFPTIAIVFGASNLASKVIYNASIVSDQNMMGLIAVAVATLPLFVVPGMLKGALKAAGTIGAKIQNWNNKAGGRLGNKVKTASPLGQMNQLRQLNSNRRQARYQGWVGRNAVSHIPGLGKMGGQMATRGETVAQQIQGEEQKAAQGALDQEIAQVRATGGDTKAFLKARASSAHHSDTEKYVAMQQIAALGMDDTIRELSVDPTVNQRQLQAAISGNAGVLLPKAPDLVKGAPKAAFGAINGSGMSMFSADTARVHVEYLHDLHSRATNATLPPSDRMDAQRELDDAVTAFNGAAADIAASPELQAKFSSSTGKAFVDTVGSIGATDPTFQAYIDLHARSGTAGAKEGLDYIQTDGKIRS